MIGEFVSPTWRATVGSRRGSYQHGAFGLRGQAGAARCSTTSRYSARRHRRPCPVGNDPTTATTCVDRLTDSDGGRPGCRARAAARTASPSPRDGLERAVDTVHPDGTSALRSSPRTWSKRSGALPRSCPAIDASQSSVAAALSAARDKIDEPTDLEMIERASRRVVGLGDTRRRVD